MADGHCRCLSLLSLAVYLSRGRDRGHVVVVAAVTVVVLIVSTQHINTSMATYHGYGPVGSHLQIPHRTRICRASATAHFDKSMFRRNPALISLPTTPFSTSEKKRTRHSPPSWPEQIKPCRISSHCAPPTSLSMTLTKNSSA